MFDWSPEPPRDVNVGLPLPPCFVGQDKDPLTSTWRFSGRNHFFPAATPPWEGYRRTKSVTMPSNGRIRTSPSAM